MRRGDVIVEEVRDANNLKPWGTRIFFALGDRILTFNNTKLDDLIMALVEYRAKACPHTKTFRGADIPLLHGSWRSEVCERCGAFRARDHHDQLITGTHGGWREPDGYAHETRSRDDDE